jgi:hypothetical protein
MCSSRVAGQVVLMCPCGHEGMWACGHVTMALPELGALVAGLAHERPIAIPLYGTSLSSACYCFLLFNFTNKRCALRPLEG